MALKKPTTAAASSTNPQFEDEPGTTATAVAEHAEAPAKAKAAEQSPAASTVVAIAKASSTSLGAVSGAASIAKAFKHEVEQMKGAADFSYGSNRVFKAKDGVIKEMAGEKLKLGRWVKVRLLAWDRHFEISPGDEGKSSSDFVAYSLDGETVDNVVGAEAKAWEGKSVQGYLDYLRKEEGFEQASRREFIDCQVAALGADEEPDFSGVIQVTLSSSSIRAFKAYQGDLEATAKCVAMGLPGYELPEDPFTFYFIREDASKGKNSWTKLKISSTLPAKI